jgi:hypothetical protein
MVSSSRPGQIRVLKTEFGGLARADKQLSKPAPMRFDAGETTMEVDPTRAPDVMPDGRKAGGLHSPVHISISGRRI